MWPITQLTHDSHDPWPTTHGYYTYAWGYRRGRGIVVLDNPLDLESKKSHIKIKPLGMIIGLIGWVSSCLMSTKNEKIASYCAVISSSWVNGSLAMTHDPLTHFHLCITDVVVLFSYWLRSTGRYRQRRSVSHVDEVQQQRHVPVYVRLLVLSRCLHHHLDVPRWRSLDRTGRRRL